MNTAACTKQPSQKRAGYEYLLAYKLTVPIYDLTVVFCRHYLQRSPRTSDQMTQAGRSGMQNTAEGNKQQSLKGYIYLAGIARGSLEELLQDYLAYARQHHIPIWSREKCMKEIGEIREIWDVIRATPVLPNNPNFPDLPAHPEKAVNLMITLINQANYFLDKLIAALKDKHMREGGLTEKLYRARVAYRGNKGDTGNIGDRGERK